MLRVRKEAPEDAKVTDISISERFVLSCVPFGLDT